MKKSKRNKPEPVLEPSVVTENQKVLPFQNLDSCIYILFLLTCIGTVMRFYNLGLNSLWLDEISTYRYATGTFEGMWQMMSTGTDYSPPLFFVVEHFVLQVFGVTEWSMRVVPAIVGAATIPLIYLVGVEFKDKYVGLVAAGFFTFSPLLLLHSQDARPYGMALFFVTVMFLFYLKAEKSGTILDWALVGVFAAVSFWTHYFTLIFTGAIISYTVLWNLQKFKEDISVVKTTVKNVAVSIGVMGIVALPLIVELIHLYTLRTAKEPTYGLRGFDIITQSLIQITYSSELYMWVLTIIFLGITGFLLLTKDRKIAGLLLWISVVMVIASIYMSDKIPFLPRYLIFMIIPLSLGIGMVSTFVKENPKNARSKLYIVMGIVIVFGLLFVPYGQAYYSQYTKENWRGIGQDLASITVPGDTVVTMPLYIYMPLNYYYNASDEQVKEMGRELGILSVEELEQVRTNSTQSVYYVLTPDIYAADPAGKSLVWLQQNAVQIRNYGNVYLFKGK